MATRPFSARLDADLLDRLQSQSTRDRVSLSHLVERLLEEAMRAEELPGIVFRPGPSGRRAGVLGGPDVWEIVRDLEGAKAAGHKDPVAHVLSVTDLTEEHLRLAAAYHHAHPDEIDAWIAEDAELAARLLAASA